MTFEPVEREPDDYSDNGATSAPDVSTLINNPRDFIAAEVNADSADDHARCAAFLKQTAQRVGLDLHVTDQPPIVAGPYTTEPMVCPHGTPFWFEPTGEQIAYYVENGIE